MNQTIEGFLSKNRISVLSVVLPDGSSHSAALHYSHVDNPLKFYFSTKRSSRKCEGLQDGKSAKASLVVGFNEEEWITMQLNGEVKIVINSDELAAIKAVHYMKHPGSKKYENDPESIFLEFIPNWWRYTDFNTKPVTILTS